MEDLIDQLRQPHNIDDPQVFQCVTRCLNKGVPPEVVDDVIRHYEEYSYTEPQLVKKVVKQLFKQLLNHKNVDVKRLSAILSDEIKHLSTVKETHRMAPRQAHRIQLPPVYPPQQETGTHRMRKHTETGRLPTVYPPQQETGTHRMRKHTETRRFERVGLLERYQDIIDKFAPWWNSRNKKNGILINNEDIKEAKARIDKAMRFIGFNKINYSPFLDNKDNLSHLIRTFIFRTPYGKSGSKIRNYTEQLAAALTDIWNNV